MMFFLIVLLRLAKPRDPEKPLMLGEERNFSLPFQISSNFYQFPQVGLGFCVQ